MKSGLVDELEKSENFYHFYWAFPRCLSFNWAICDRCHRRHQVNNYHGFTVKMINGGFVCCEQTATLCDWNNQKIPKLLRTSILKIILIIKRTAEDDLRHGWSSLALRGRHNARCENLLILLKTFFFSFACLSLSWISSNKTSAERQEIFGHEIIKKMRRRNEKKCAIKNKFSLILSKSFESIVGISTLELEKHEFLIG